MRKLLTVILILSSTSLILSCANDEALDQKFTKENYSAIMAEHADSTSRSAFNRAMVENEVNDIRNEDFTYQELIDQGKELQKNEQPDKTITR